MVTINFHGNRKWKKKKHLKTHLKAEHTKFLENEKKGQIKFLHISFEFHREM